MIFRFLCLALVFGAGKARAQEGAFSDFRLGVLAIKEGSFSDPLSIDLHWTPRLTHNDLTVRGDISMSFINPSGTDQFALFGYEVFIEQLIEDNVSVEVGGGFQNFLEHGGIAPVAGVHLIFGMDKNSRLFKGTYVGISKSFGDESSWQGRAGLILNID